MKIFLGSSSPRRKKILGEIINSFEIISPDLSEDIIESESPLQYAERVSRDKAKNIIPHITEIDPFLLITCDTIVTIDNKIIGKPSSYDEAFSILNMLSGRTHNVISSITLTYKKAQISVKSSAEISAVTFTKINKEAINNYLKSFNYMDKAGAYAIQENGFSIIKNINGSITNIIGFPLRLFFNMLYDLDITEEVLSDDN